MKKTLTLLVAALLCTALQASAQSADMSFFLTSAGPGNGADLGGLEGADAHCVTLAEAAGITGKTWHAYLSTAGEHRVNARDRIGDGPWFNFEGVMVAQDVTNLHSEDDNLTKATVLDEWGHMVNGRGDDPNRHDILTGANLDGTVFATGTDTPCGNWTSSDGEGSARVGHFDRAGGGDNPTSWNSAHSSRGCGQEDLQGTGGDGLFYCFAVDAVLQPPFPGPGRLR